MRRMGSVMGNSYHIVKASWNNNWVLEGEIKVNLLGLTYGGYYIKLGSKTEAGLIYNTVQAFLQGGRRQVYDKME